MVRLLRKLFFHVGMPKSASSSIQRFMLLNHAALADQGIRYDFTPKQSKRGQGNGGRLAKADRENDTKTFQTLSDHALRGSDANPVISSEFFTQRYGSAKIANLFSQARSTGHTPYVILIFRRQDLYIESAFKQQIKGGRDWINPFEELVVKKGPILNYVKIANGWKKLVGETCLKVIFLNHTQSKTYILERFLDILGVQSRDHLDFASALEINASPPAGLIEPARLLKADLIKAGMRLPVIQDRLKKFFEFGKAEMDVPKRKFLQPHAARVDMLEKYSSGNDKLKRDFAVVEEFEREVLYDPASELPLDTEAEQLYEFTRTYLPELWALTPRSRHKDRRRT